MILKLRLKVHQVPYSSVGLGRQASGDAKCVSWEPQSGVGKQPSFINRLSIINCVCFAPFSWTILVVNSNLRFVMRVLLGLFIFFSGASASARSCGDLVHELYFSYAQGKVDGSLSEVCTEIKRQFPKFDYSVSFFRGFSQETFGAVLLIKSLFGDPLHELQSWDLTRAFEKNKAQGMDPYSALIKAKQGLLRKIKTKLKTKGHHLFGLELVGETSAGKTGDKKSGEAIPFDDAMSSMVIEFAALNLTSQVTLQPKKISNLQGIVLEIEQSDPRGFPVFGQTEYHILSHLDSTQITSARIGFPLSAKMDSEGNVPAHWFHLKLERSAPGGPITRLSLDQIEYVPYEDFNFLKPIFDTGNFRRNGYRIDRKKILKEFPELEAFLDEISLNLPA